MSRDKSTPWFSDFVAAVQKLGFVKSIVYIFLFCFFSYVSYIIANPAVIFEKFNNYSEEQHIESFNYRMEQSPRVQSYMDQLVLESDCLRSFIVEMHNGKYNASGLSFNYGSLTYEGLRDGTESIVEDYDDFSLERFPILTKVYNDGFWYGSIDELSEIDKRLSLRLASNGAKYVGLMTVYGEKDAIGFIGITYAEDDAVDEAQVKKDLVKYSSKISPLIDGAKAKSRK